MPPDELVRVIWPCLSCVDGASAGGRRLLGPLDRADISYHSVRIVAVEPEHRHIFMAGQQSPANSLRELAQVGSAVQRSKARRGGKEAITGCFDGMAAAAQPLGDDLATLLRCLRLTRP